jgi:hypothetical protein
MTTNNIHGGMRIFVTRFLPHKKNKEKREEKIKKIQNIKRIHMKKAQKIV